MILRQITLKNVGCFPYTLTLGPFCEGLNLVYAPNETGKSTVVTAVGRALFDRYKAAGKTIEALRPWGTRVAPEVHIVLKEGQQEYLLEKRFLQGPLCQLRKLVGGGFEAFEEGDGADTFVRDLLRGELTGNERWGLAHALWCLQEPGKEMRCNVSTAVAAQLRDALPGAAPSSTRYETLGQLVENRYRECFAEKTGRVKSNSVVDTLTKKLVELSDRIGGLQSMISQTEEAGRGLARTQIELGRLKEQKLKHADALAEYGRQVLDLQDLTRQIDAVNQEAAALRKQHADLAHDRHECEETVAKVGQLTKAVQNLRQRLSETREERLRQQGAVQTLTQQAEGAREALKASAAAGSRLRAIRRARQAQGALATLAETITLLAELQTQAAEVEGELQRPWPSAQDVTATRQLADDLTRLQAQLQIAGLTLTMTLEGAQAVTLSGGSQALTVEGSAGEAIAYQAGAQLQVRLPGVAQLSVTSGAREAADLAEELQQAEVGLTDLLKRFSVEQVHELPELQSRQQALLRRRKELQAEVKRLAGEAKDLAGLENQRAATVFELSRLLAQVGLTAEQLASQQIGNEAELEAAEQTARSAEDEAQRRLQAAQESLQAQQEAEQTLTQEGAALGTDEQVARAQVEALLKRHGVADVLALREREQGAAAALREREEALVELQHAVPAADPQALAAAQRQALGEIEADERRLHDMRVRFEVNIEQAQSQGRYEDLVLLEERQQSVQQQLARARLEAHSIRLLRQVLEERRQDAVSPQLPHLEEAIQRMMLAITGQDRLIKVDDAYKVEGMLDRRSEDEVHGFDALSAGTREQLDLVTRVALGEAYADKYGPTMMVLDDALLYTDPERHDKVKLILQRAEARKLQVFIFTSHPDRYRGIVEEPFRFDLAALAAGARASG